MTCTNMFLSREAPASWPKYHINTTKHLATPLLLTKGEQACADLTVAAARGSCK